MPGSAPVKQYQGLKKLASTGKAGTLLESFVDGFYNKTITGRSLKKAKGVIDYLAAPVEPRARKKDREDVPRLRKQDRGKSTNPKGY